MKKEYIKLNKKQTDDLFNRIYKDDKYKNQINGLKQEIYLLQDKIEALELQLKVYNEMKSKYPEEHNKAIRTVTKSMAFNQPKPESEIEVDDGEIYMKYN